MLSLIQVGSSLVLVQDSNFACTVMHVSWTAILTISGAHKHLEGVDDGAVEGPAEEGAGAAAGPFHGEAQPVVLVLHSTRDV